MYYLFERIKEAKNGDEEAMLKLIYKFDPLLKAFGRKTGLEDGYEEMVVSFIELILKFPINKFNRTLEAEIVGYIETSIKNRVRDIWRKERVVIVYELEEYDSPEEEKSYRRLEWEWMLNCLPNLQHEIIVRNIWNQESIIEIANSFHMSRQYVNRERKRALLFLKELLRKNGGCL